MSNTLAMFNPESLQEKLASMVKNTLFDEIPPEVYKAMVNKEMKAFFETEDWVRVEAFKKEELNPRYDPTKNGYYDEKRTKEFEYQGLSRKMTPFRQLVWQILSDMLRQDVMRILDAQREDRSTEFGKWLTEVAESSTAQGGTNLFNQLVVLMAGRQMDAVISLASMNTKTEISMLLQAARVDLRDSSGNPLRDTSGMPVQGRFATGQ